VLSGFVISYAYPSLGGREAFFFLAARAARLFPAHVLTLVYAALVLYPDSASVETFVPNLLLVQAFIPDSHWYYSYNGVAWSISAEWFFYLAFPFLIRGWAKTFWWKWIAAIILAGAMIALAGPIISAMPGADALGVVYINPLARVLEFVLGMVACLAFRCWQDAGNRLLSEPTATRAELLCVLVAALSLRWPPLAELAKALNADPNLILWLKYSGGAYVFPSAILLFAFGRGAVSRFLCSRPMVLLGEISFSVYLIHQLSFKTYMRYVQPHLSHWAAGLCIAITLVLSYAMWRYVERPARDYVKASLRLRRVSAAASADPM
jgi:peptidoglycan/LPS O-acetylase OafA/YrhL